MSSSLGLHRRHQQQGIQVAVTFIPTYRWQCQQKSTVLLCSQDLYAAPQHHWRSQHQTCGKCSAQDARQVPCHIEVLLRGMQVSTRLYVDSTSAFARTPLQFAEMLDVSVVEIPSHFYRRKSTLNHPVSLFESLLLLCSQPERQLQIP